MEITVIGSPKEIAALVLALQERRVEVKLEREPYERHRHICVGGGRVSIWKHC